jgi:2-methylcitrate dehydratase PrpD
LSEKIDGLAHFVAQTGWQDIPEPVQRYTKLVLLDTLGVILAGFERPEMRALQAGLAGSAGSGATVMARGWPTTDPRTAALLNGIAGRSIELCEGLRLVSGQAAMQVLPGVLAVSEQKQRSGREMLTAFLVGYEVAGRFCSAFTPRPFAHQNGQASLLGAVAAGARLQGLEGAGIGRAMRIATTLLLTPSYTNTVAGATTLNVAGGMSGFAAALAPELALAGFEAKDDAIDEALGSMVGNGFDTFGLLDELGMSWQIMRNYFRLHACCNPIHPALDCLDALIAELRPKPHEIDRIDVATYRFASIMQNPEPSNYFASKYSLPHAAAAMIVNGHAGYSSLDDAALSNPTIKALRRLVHVQEDSEMTAVAPRLRPARVTVSLKNGRSATIARQSHRGDFQEPYAEVDIRGKFRELAGVVLTEEGAIAVEAAVDRSDQWQSLQDLVILLRRYSRW